MKLLSLLLLIPLLSPVTYALSIENNDIYEDACRYNIQGWIYLHIEGEPYQRGFQHGYLLYAEIADMIYRWSNVIHNAPFLPTFTKPEVDSSKYEEISASFWRQCRDLAMRIFWDDYPEEYQQEIKGIADGAKNRGVKIYDEPISYEDVLTMNEMYELMSILVNPQKSIHPFRNIIDVFSNVIPGLNYNDVDLGSTFSFSHHCNGFTAVGNATKDGKIVISDSVWCGGWWYSYYIAQRWNVIIDIDPSEGHRMMIATSPGLIWSDEDYYQNEVGLAMIETTFVQGVYKLNGLPLAIRARLGMQYGNNIDDIIRYFLMDNTGVMNAQWLIADAEENEIALFEQGLYEYSVQRTKNGFFWSANNPFNFKVRREVLRNEVLKAPIYRLASILLNTSGFQYYTLFYTPSERDLKFEELGNQFYGKIDSEVVKIIMHTPPMTDFTSDTKITDGNMIFNNTLWAFWGNPTGEWNTSGLEMLRGAKTVPPTGWVKIYGVPYNFNPNYKKGLLGKGADSTTLWDYTFSDNNYDYASLKTNGNTIYAAYENNLLALNQNGSIIWQKAYDNTINSMAANEQGLYIATDDNSYAYSNDGAEIWQGLGGKTIIAVDETVYLSNENGIYRNGKEKITDLTGNLFSFDKETLYLIKDNKIITEDWVFEMGGPALDLEIDKHIYLGNSDGNLYCIDKDGNELLKFTVGWFVNDVVINDDNIFIGSADGNVYSINTEGDTHWIFSCNASVSGLKLYGDLVFVTTTEGRFYALNRTNGSVEYSIAPSYEIEGLYNYITTPLSPSIVAINGKVVFSASGSIYCLDAQTIEIESLESDSSRNGLLLAASIIFIVAFFSILTYFLFVLKKGDK